MEETIFHRTTANNEDSSMPNMKIELCERDEFVVDVSSAIAILRNGLHPLSSVLQAQIAIGE